MQATKWHNPSPPPVQTGVLILLDSRIALSGYSFTTDFADVENFLASC